MKRTKPDTIQEPKQIALWEAFNTWADQNDIGDHPDDWGIWFDCFVSGAYAGVHLL